MEKKLDRIFKRFKELKSEKQNWLPHYELIGQFVMLRKQHFTSTGRKGEFLANKIYDSTAPRALQIAVSTIMGMLWINGAKTFRLAKPYYIKDTEEIKSYYEEITRRIAIIMDSVEAGFILALSEYLTDQLAFGTSGIGVFAIDEYPYVRYEAWDVKTMFIDEGSDRLVNTIYNLKEMTIRQAVEVYGLLNLSQKTQQSYERGKENEKIKILQVLEPRKVLDPTKKGNLFMPIASYHIEYDTKHLIKESGFEELPVYVARFYKVLGEVYGRSPTMQCLPDTLELNYIQEQIRNIIGKLADPPLAVIDDGTLGGGVINKSAGSVTVFDGSGGIPPDKLMYPMFFGADPSQFQFIMEQLKNNILDAFFLDRLLDLNNETRMTLGEAQIRAKIRGESIGSIFLRQLNEMLTPVIDRTVNLAFDRGHLGKPADDPNLKEYDLVIPEEVLKVMAEGKHFYDIHYISPAMRIINAEETQGIMTTFEFATNMAQGKPDILDNLDGDEAIRRLSELTGGTGKILTAYDDMLKEREARMQRAEEQRQADLARNASEIARNQAQANAQQSKGYLGGNPNG